MFRNTGLALRDMVTSLLYFERFASQHPALSLCGRMLLDSSSYVRDLFTAAYGHGRKDWVCSNCLCWFSFRRSKVLRSCFCSGVLEASKRIMEGQLSFESTSELV